MRWSVLSIVVVTASIIVFFTWRYARDDGSMSLNRRTPDVVVDDVEAPEPEVSPDVETPLREGALRPPLETAEDCYRAHAGGKLRREDFTEDEWLAIEAKTAEHLWMKEQSLEYLREVTVGRWAGLPDPAVLAAKLSVSLDDTAREELRAIEAEHRVQIEAAGRGIPELVRALMQEQWSDGGFHRFPNPAELEDVRAVEPQVPGLLSTAGGGPVGDHCYHFVFDSQSYPVLESRLDGLEQVRRESVERMIAYLETLR
jgi:hypothetical protein